MSHAGEIFLKRIEKAESLTELEQIVERAADILESTQDYIEVYQTALRKAQGW